MTSSPGNLYDFRKAFEGYGLSQALYVYVVTIATELRNPDQSPLFEIVADKSRQCVIKSVSSGQEFTFSYHDLGGGQPRTALQEDALMEAFYAWCMENCPPHLQIACDMVTTQAHQAVNQLRREQSASGFKPDQKPS